MTSTALALAQLTLLPTSCHSAPTAHSAPSQPTSAMPSTFALTTPSTRRLGQTKTPTPAPTPHLRLALARLALTLTRRMVPAVHLKLAATLAVASSLLPNPAACLRSPSLSTPRQTSNISGRNTPWFPVRNPADSATAGL